ncbi:type 11 methyltransferase [Oleiphilus messinensis]|uniref:Type 11 methyltransferase n=1 Tax=Oleiphilus messinensis TaxID=141451 RepID=A0A1Y0IFB6_9GAMM|nr:class I SAM-dependent methyltransferase [Oleiphilus messinensis]ARU59171.1 type 11 methyltransferase [Oleiphilus messinensis]
MNKDEIKALFDQQAEGYDQQWSHMAPINDGLYFFLGSIFADLPPESDILCIGAGTGKELLYLGERFPNWTFTVIEPSAKMLTVCKNSLQQAGMSDRCYFHEGYLETLPQRTQHDGATSFLVSQFILNPDDRSAFFREIAGRLKPESVMVSTDLAADTSAPEYEKLLSLWLTVMANAKVSEDMINRVKTAYNTDVAVIPAKQIGEIISAGGFEHPVQFYQAGLIHGFYAVRGRDC